MIKLKIDGVEVEVNDVSEATAMVQVLRPGPVVAEAASMPLLQDVETLPHRRKGEPITRNLTKKAKDALRVLCSNPDRDWPFRDVAEELGIPEQAAGQRLCMLVHKGYAIRTGAGIYRVAEDYYCNLDPGDGVG